MEPAEALKLALYHGHHDRIAAILRADPAVGRANFGLMCALYDAEGVSEALASDRAAAVTPVGPRTPILHLAFSRHISGRGSPEAMAEVARALLAAGADPSDAFEPWPGAGHRLSALYGAIGHADNPALAQILLEAGASPDDCESLYHATELGHSDGLRLLLAHGARPEGTNALLRALDFDNAQMVAMLLAAGADPDEALATGGPGALHQAARRMCGARVTDLLLAAGAKADAPWNGITAYALAVAHGNAIVAEMLAHVGADRSLAPEEQTLAAAAEGEDTGDARLDEARLPDEYRLLLCRLAGRAGALPHIRRLVALGLDPDVADEAGLLPLHLAAWEGRLETMTYFLSFGPDIEEINGYGGTLLTTILHGAGARHAGGGHDPEGCLRLALEAGALVPEAAISSAPGPLATILEQWLRLHPDRLAGG